MRHTFPARVISKDRYEASLEEERRAFMAAIAVLAETTRREVLAGSAQTICDVAVACAERIVGNEIRTDPDVVRSMARELLSHVSNAPLSRIRVHEGDFDAVKELGLTTEIDASLDRGDCVILTELGSVDGRIKTKIAALEEALKDSIVAAVDR